MEQYRRAENRRRRWNTAVLHGARRATRGDKGGLVEEQGLPAAAAVGLTEDRKELLGDAAKRAGQEREQVFVLLEK